ncbi:MAG: damage-control phosphatase ARMT1 family protein [Candidatus Thorarchaeota archaeon]
MPDCSTCILNSLETLIPMLAESKEEQFKLMKTAYARLSEGYKKGTEPAPLSIELYRELYTLSGKEDPYKEIKLKSIQFAEKTLPLIEDSISQTSDFERLRATLAAAIAGNIIDFNTAGHDPDLENLFEVYKDIRKEGFQIDDSEQLWITLKSKSGTVVFLGDNAGETLFDIPILRLLNELSWKVFYVVKGKPMVNDATVDDVKGTEIESLTTIVDSGAWAHGVPKRWVSQRFLKLVSQSDLVISKGQANIETFPEIQRALGVETFYVTKAKCPHISQAIGATKGDSVVLRRPSLS